MKPSVLKNIAASEKLIFNFLHFRTMKSEEQMNSDAHDCCRCSGKMREGRHDFMARVGKEIVVIKDIPALICDTCGEVEYTQEISREIDVIMKEFFAGRLLAKPLAAGQTALKSQRADSIA
jgi:YgiT-type zinc finger domain-containing protein